MEGPHPMDASGLARCGLPSHPPGGLLARLAVGRAGRPQCSLAHPPQVKATTRNAKSRRGRAASAKMTAGVLLELGLHHPLAAALGGAGQSELAMALEWLSQRPAQALLLADRWHRCAAFPAQAQAACPKVGRHFFFCARSDIHVKVLLRCKDGRRLVRLPVRQKGHRCRSTDWLELAGNPRARAARGPPGAGGALVDQPAGPQERASGRVDRTLRPRWEHELYDRELKRPWRKSQVLQSHTLETGAQEIAALVLDGVLATSCYTRS